MKTKIQYAYLQRFARLSCGLLLFLTISCKKFVEIEPPQNQIPSELVFTDDKTATSSVTGLYIRMMQNNSTSVNSGISIYTALSADEIYNVASSSGLDAVYNNSIPSDLTFIQNNLWAFTYGYVYHANACIEGLAQSTAVTPAVKNQLLGEVKFLRGFYYLYLANLFGEVPLTIATDYRKNEMLSRTATAEIYKQAIVDLKEAQKLLLPAYPTAGVVRANKWAATALLARAYLYQKDWANAEAAATEVITSGMYSLLANLNSVFLANSKEAVLQFMPIGTFNSAEGAAFVPTSATVRPTYALNNALLGAFENGDLRKTNWLAKKHSQRR